MSDRATLLQEYLNDDAGYFLRAATLIDSGVSDYQSWEVWDTPQFGKLFRLDGCFMTSERDEFYYHENLIHVTALAHPGPRTALIIGGGDGGSVEELFKHPDMESVVLVELDAQVIEIARQHLHSIHRGALDDPRLELRVEDGLHYVRQIAPASARRFDLIVLDLTDPVGPAADLYTRQFFADCKALLSEQGGVALHLGAPVFQPARVRRLLDNLRAVFSHACPYFMYIPLYGSLWSMASASDHLVPQQLDAATIDAHIARRGIKDLQYYNGAMHCAQFALPNYLRTLLG